MKNYFLAFLSFAIISSNLRAAEIAKPTFKFWDDNEVNSCDRDGINSISLQLPSTRMAEQLAYLGYYLCEQIIGSGALDRVEEIPSISEFQTTFARLKAVANYNSDYSRRTVDSTAKVVSEYQKRQDLFDSLLNRDGSRNLAKKMLRLQVELAGRVSP
jgi:hypothetical protein